MVVQYEINVTGRVQGVGFRYFVEKRASELNITGWVKNIPDGSVLVMAQGDEEDIKTFIDYLRIGPSLAKVADVTINRMPEPEKLSRFEVKY